VPIGANGAPRAASRATTQWVHPNNARPRQQAKSRHKGPSPMREQPRRGRVGGPYPCDSPIAGQGRAEGEQRHAVNTTLPTEGQAVVGWGGGRGGGGGGGCCNHGQGRAEDRKSSNNDRRKPGAQAQHKGAAEGPLPPEWESSARVKAEHSTKTTTTAGSAVAPATSSGRRGAVRTLSFWLARRSTAVPHRTKGWRGKRAIRPRTAVRGRERTLTVVRPL
jgi:hypothetical protein